MNVKINYVAVGVAAIAMWLLGAIWYNVFSAQWMMYAGVTEEMGKSMSGMDVAIMYGGSIIAFFITFYVQSHIHHAFNVQDIKGALQAAVWSWLGFAVTVMFVNNSYQGKSVVLTIIDSGYWLIGMGIGGLILVKMQKRNGNVNER